MRSFTTKLCAVLASTAVLAMAACSSSSAGVSSTSGNGSGSSGGTTTGVPALTSGVTSGGSTSGNAVTGTTSGSTTGSASATTGGTTTSGPPPFLLTFAPVQANTPANASLSITVNINRDPNNTGTAFVDPLQLSLADSPDGGITAVFSPNPVDANQTVMTLSVVAGVSPADHLISVLANDTVNLAVQSSTGFDVNVSTAAMTLLVDNDASANNANPPNPNAKPSASDTLFATLLGPVPQGVNLPYASFVVPADGSGSSTPSFSQLQNYDTVIWYTGANAGPPQPTMSAAQEAALTGWLDTGNKTLILFSENLVADLAGADWVDAPADNLLANYLGAVGTDVDGDLAHVTFTATGTSLFNDESYNVVQDTPLASTADRINPGDGVDALITVNYDETESGTPDPVPVAVGQFNVGTAGTSTIVYVGIPIENIQVQDGTESSNLQLFQLVLSYALPTG